MGFPFSMLISLWVSDFSSQLLNICSILTSQYEMSSRFTINLIRVSLSVHYLVGLLPSICYVLLFNLFHFGPFYTCSSHLRLFQLYHFLLVNFSLGLFEPCLSVSFYDLGCLYCTVFAKFSIGFSLLHGGGGFDSIVRFLLQLSSGNYKWFSCDVGFILSSKRFSWLCLMACLCRNRVIFFCN